MNLGDVKVPHFLRRHSMSLMWGGGFIPITIYGGFFDEDHLITQSNLNILTQASQTILVQKAL